MAAGLDLVAALSSYREEVQFGRDSRVLPVLRQHFVVFRKGGAVVEKARLDLVSSLGAVFNDAWEDEALRDRLIAEPRTVLGEHGIQLPATVKVEAELVQTAPDAQQGTVDDLVAEWSRMVEEGTVKLKVPGSRPAGATELADEELEGVSGGMLNHVPNLGPDDLEQQLKLAREKVSNAHG